ncbi:hypothetical protein KIN20_024097 [Parelaphostrongylus tenuis]|uniref:Uncharacterized protein n=1 Tax=Parelaphostrongylus tenuis TaxID=148309 RepID=A0AAD5QVQ9_PARTN|nr:hypothetical protein KIN20_024097 [Parelaphostrongylus tenuis]
MESQLAPTRAINDQMRRKRPPPKNERSVEENEVKQDLMKADYQFNVCTVRSSSRKNTLYWYEAGIRAEVLHYPLDTEHFHHCKL